MVGVSRLRELRPAASGTTACAGYGLHETKQRASRSLRRATVVAVAVALGLTAGVARARPPVARGAAAIAAAVGRTSVMAFSGVRAPGACLVPIRAFGAVSANGVKISFGAVQLREVTFTVHDKRTRRVEILGLGGNSFCMLVAPSTTVRVPMPAGFGPPLAMRVEPASPLPSTSELFR